MRWSVFKAGRRGQSFMFSIKNAVYVALMQIGVIVTGVLAAGLWVREQKVANLILSTPAEFLTGHSDLFMAIPVVWITCAALVHRRPELSDGVKDLIVFSGVLILAGLGVFFVYADVTPLFNITWTLSGDADR